MAYLDKNGFVDLDFAQLLVWLAAATGSELSLSDQRVKSYAQDLGDVPWDDLKAACAAARRECKFFPTIPEIRRHLGPTPEDAALIAWAMLDNAARSVGSYASVVIADGAAADALVLAFGSWPEFAEAEDGPDLAQRRQVFLAAYRTARRNAQAIAQPRRLPGRCAAEGAVKGLVGLIDSEGSRLVEDAPALQAASSPAVAALKA